MSNGACEGNTMSPMGNTLELLDTAIARNQEQANLLRDRLKMLVIPTPQCSGPAEKCSEPNRCGLDDRLTDAVARLDATHGILQAVLDGLQL
jgi:hypothetical protein